MSSDFLKGLNISSIILDIDGYGYTVSNKNYVSELEITSGDIMKIKWLGTLEVIGIMRVPDIRNKHGEQVWEVTILTKKKVS